jgi:chromosome segregation ATPase
VPGGRLQAAIDANRTALQKTRAINEAAQRRLVRRLGAEKERLAVELQHVQREARDGHDSLLIADKRRYALEAKLRHFEAERQVWKAKYATDQAKIEASDGMMRSYKELLEKENARLATEIALTDENARLAAENARLTAENARLAAEGARLKAVSGDFSAMMAAVAAFSSASEDLTGKFACSVCLCAKACTRDFSCARPLAGASAACRNRLCADCLARVDTCLLCRAHKIAGK